MSGVKCQSVRWRSVRVSGHLASVGRVGPGGVVTKASLFTEGLHQPRLAARTVSRPLKLETILKSKGLDTGLAVEVAGAVLQVAGGGVRECQVSTCLPPDGLSRIWRAPRDPGGVTHANVLPKA